MARSSSDVPMQGSPARFVFWWRWLLVVTAGVVLFGALLLLVPGLTRQLFSLLLYGAQGRLDALGAEARA